MSAILDLFPAFQTGKAEIQALAVSRAVRFAKVPPLQSRPFALSEKPKVLATTFITARSIDVPGTPISKTAIPLFIKALSKLPKAAEGAGGLI